MFLFLKTHIETPNLYQKISTSKARSNGPNSPLVSRFSISEFLTSTHKIISLHLPIIVSRQYIHRYWESSNCLFHANLYYLALVTKQQKSIHENSIGTGRKGCQKEKERETSLISSPPKHTNHRKCCSMEVSPKCEKYKKCEGGRHCTFRSLRRHSKQNCRESRHNQILKSL